VLAGSASVPYRVTPLPPALMSDSSLETSSDAAGRAGRLVGAVLAIVLLAAVVARAGVVRYLMGEAERGTGRTRLLRVWDWWSPSTNEKYAAYFGEIEREFEAAHPDVDVLFQFVPFGQYEQKMATGLVGASPPDVFQSSVYWAEGFYDRGMLLPLDPYLARERADRERRRAAGESVDPGEIVDQEAYLESAWRHNTKPDGTVFGIPQILDANCLTWNLDLLKKAAQTDPDIRGMFLKNADGAINWSRLRFDAVRDWPQFRRICRKLTRYDAKGVLALDGKGEPVQAGFSIHAHGNGSGPLLGWQAANGSSFQDVAGTRALFADPGGVEAMQFLLDLYWKDHVSPPFRRQMSDEEVFNTGRVACMVAGTWSGKYITRDTEGRIRFDATPFPPGPHGDRHRTVTWGNMLVISRRTRDADLAWEYVKFVASLKGSLRLLRHIQQNSPRRDFYQSAEWRAVCETHPYLWNVPEICASGKKLRNTQINAIDQATSPIFETILLHGPEIESGRGPYPSVEAGLQAAAAAADRVYARYNDQVAYWHRAAR
jgi:ABC-type glycerol-3-phosphate transport system substrate-binding protein